jgi:hypothetical protein
MKKLLLISTLFLTQQLFAQSFSDDFESYAVGAYVAKSNNKWTTWSNTPGSTEDTKVSSEQAHSGTKSAKFSSTAANGGPTDLVLPFFGSLTKTYDVGVFESSMWLYVPSGKNGYFNYQAVAPVGKTWAMDIHFDADGTFRCVSSGAGGLQGSTTYKQDTWVKYSCLIDLTSNQWTIKLDDVKVASFSTTNNSLFAMDIYPVDASALFYVDDVTTTFTPFVPKQLDAAMTAIKLKNKALKGKIFKVGGTVRNLGKDTITSIDYSWGDGVSEYEESLKNLKILPLGSYSFTATDTYKADPAASLVNFTVKKVNGKTDDEATNDKKDLVMNVITPAPGKIIVAEQATGTWCQWCPRGHVFMGMMEKEYEGYFIGIAGHGGSATEPMAFADYTNYVVDDGFPSVYVDRKTKMNPDLIEDSFFSRITEPAHGKVENKATYNKTTRALNVDVKVTFNNNVKAGDYKLVTLIVEDSIKGTTSAYNQSNAYANNAAGVMGGYEKLPNPVPASKMIYEHVARAALTTVEGDDLVSSPKSGDVVTKSFTFDVPATYKEKQLEVVSFILDATGSSNTGNRIEYGNFSFSSATNDLTDHPFVQNIYPNPTTETAYIDMNIKDLSEISISVTDMNGKVVVTRDYGKMAGSNLFPIQCAEFATGVYFVRISIGNEVVTKKLVKE